MRHARISLLVLSLFAAGAVADSQPTLNLYTFHSPPYQIGTGKDRDSTVNPVGTTVETVRCITGRMGWQTRIRTVPQKRAIHGLQNHLIDGYFAVDESDVMNRFAQATAPVALEKWYFYSREPIDDVTNASIAAIAGSNEAIWLEHSLYDTALTVSYPEQLLALLERNRVDAVLMDERVMDLLRQEGSGPTQLHRYFVRFVPLRLYLTQPFAAHHPAFLLEFNSYISPCVKDGFELSEEELATVAGRARHLMNELVSRYDLVDWLRNQEPGDELSRILELDRRWQQLAPARASEKADEILRKQLSGRLAQWQYEKGGTVTEILVMDATGTNVAQSVLTSDYWQGDERKFEALVGRGGDTLYIGPVRFDPSTRQFQVETSIPVHDPVSGYFLGAVSMGLAIEEVLRSQYMMPFE